MKNSVGPLDNQTLQTEWKTAPLAKVQLREYENQTLKAFVAASRSYAKFDCLVACQNISLLATAHDHDFRMKHTTNEFTRPQIRNMTSSIKLNLLGNWFTGKGFD